jgi:transcriptional regulator with XRE-family HTH domain
MRVQLSEKNRAYLFTQLKIRWIGLAQIAAVTGVSIRTITDWKRGKYTIPAQKFEIILDIAEIDKSSMAVNVLEDWWSNSDAGLKGATIRTQRHGLLGTPASRRLGGKNSYSKRMHKKGDIYTRNELIEPAKGALLAEFVGIMIGDGGVTKYQVTIALSSLVDEEYSEYVVELIEKLFGLRPKVSKRKNSNCLVVVVSSVALVEFLVKNGVLQGDKIRQNLDIPDWILANNEYTKSCIRGIFDTDGCVFQERHIIKGKKYSYLRWTTVSASIYLRESIHKTLINLAFSPKMRNNRSVNLERSDDIERYFRLIGTSNPKHLSRFTSFGGVG